MPTSLLSIDECTILNWDNYVVITINESLQNHHIILLEECFKNKDVFKSLPAVLDLMRLTHLSHREKHFLSNLHENIPRLAILSNVAINDALKQARLYDSLPITKDFQSALKSLGVVYQHKLDVNFVNIFVKSTLKSLTAQISEPLSIGKPSSTFHPVTGDIFGIIPISSTHFSALTLLSFTETSLTTLYKQVFQIEPSQLKSELDGFLADLLEIIHETARNDLCGKGYIFMPAVSTVARKAIISSHLSEKLIFLNVPIQFQGQEFHICVGVEK
jgi:hypothetical protein